MRGRPPPSPTYPNRQRNTMTTYDTGQNDSEMGEEQLQNAGQIERNQGSNESQS